MHIYIDKIEYCGYFKQFFWYLVYKVYVYKDKKISVLLTMKDGASSTEQKGFGFIHTGGPRGVVSEPNIHTIKSRFILKNESVVLIIKPEIRCLICFIHIMIFLIFVSYF